MNIRLSALCILSSITLMVSALHAQAAEPPAAAATASSTTTLMYPLIPKFGGVYPLKNVDAQPDPNAEFKIVVDVTSTGAEQGQPYASLERLARLVNLLSYSGVPPERMHIVALLDRSAGVAAFTNATSRKYFKQDNPNLEILRALKKAGVKLLVCGQMLAEGGMTEKDIDPSVTVALSALTVPVFYEQQGYSYMQL